MNTQAWGRMWGDGRRAAAAAAVEGEPAPQGRYRIAAKLLSNRQRAVLALLTLSRIAVGVCDLAVAGAMYLLFLLLQQQVPAHPPRWLPATMLPVAVLTFMLVLSRVGADLYSARAVVHQIQKLHAGLLLRLTQGYQEMDWGRFAEDNRGELSNHALHTTREAAEFYQRGMELTAAVAIVMAMTAALVYESPMAAGAFAVALGGFYGLHRILIRDRVRQAAARREDALRLLQRNFADALASGKEVRTYGNQTFFQARIRRQARRLAAAHVNIQFLPRIVSSVADQGAVLLFLGIIVVVNLQQGDVHRLLALLAFYFVLSRRLIPLMSQIATVAGQMESSCENVRIVSAELDRCGMHRAAAVPSPAPGHGVAVELEGVSFGYPNQEPILRQVSVCVREGELIVLHGASGSGKSTLLNLIAGVLRPAAGVVRIDRSSVAYVPQEIALLDESIRTNLLFGLPEKSDAELMSALATARLKDFVDAQGRGLEAGAGDNGALWSGGQRQRLGIARAVLREARVLLLDEATSALDADNESQMFQHLRASGRTIVLVTHRAPPLEVEYRAFRLEQGRLTEQYPAPSAGTAPALAAGE